MWDKSIERREVMKKKVLCLLLASAMVFGLAACGDGDKETPGTG